MLPELSRPRPTALLADGRAPTAGGSTARPPTVRNHTYACALPGPIPHHGPPFWLSGQTRQADLIPACKHHHHDVHEGHKTLRLRDGRLINEFGWVTETGDDQAQAS